MTEPARPRRISALLCAASAALCIAILVLWVRSYRGCDVFLQERGPRDRLTLSSEFGLLVFEVEWPQPATIQPGWSYFQNPLPRRFGVGRRNLGFAAYVGAARHYLLLPPTELWGISIPHWFAFLLTATPPALWFARRAQRRRPGTCPECGYDLRASPDRCPECGAPVRVSAPPANFPIF